MYDEYWFIDLSSCLRNEVHAWLFSWNVFVLVFVFEAIILPFSYTHKNYARIQFNILSCWNSILFHVTQCKYSTSTSPSMLPHITLLLCRYAFSDYSHAVCNFSLKISFHQILHIEMIDSLSSSYTGYIVEEVNN